MSAKKPQHFHNPEGVGAMSMPGYQEVVEWIDEALEPDSINCYTGVPGTGKTFAITRALWERRGQVRSVAFESPKQPTMRRLLSDLAQEMGIEHSGKATIQDLTILLRDELKPNEEDDRILCVVVDECQRMRSTECPEVLRSLVEHPSTSFALLLVGGVGAYEVLKGEPMLWSRILYPVEFYPMECEEVVEMLPSYCPSLYDGVDPALLEWIDREHCHGLFRNWAGFTRRAQSILKKTRRRKLTKELALHAMKQK